MTQIPSVQPSKELSDELREKMRFRRWDTATKLTLAVFREGYSDDLIDERILVLGTFKYFLKALRSTKI